MQRMLVVLKSRHRLLHLQASLKRKWSQLRRHSMYIGPPLNSIISLRRDDFMAIDMGKLKNKETIILPIFWERDTSRGILKEFTIDSWKILISWISARTWSNWRGMRPDGQKTRRKIFPIIWRKQNTFDTERIGGSLNKSGNDTQLVRDRSDFNDALTTWNRLHQESGEQQLRPVLFWKYQKWHQSSSSSSSWWHRSDSCWSS